MTAGETTLRKVAKQFLNNLSPDDKEEARQEIYKFVRWFGWERTLDQFTIPEIASYSEQVPSSPEALKRLETIKTFLAYAYREGLTKINLAPYIRTRKTLPKPTSASKQPPVSVSLTAEGYAELEAKLSTLKAERPHVVEELRKAAADKDFRENAPLEAARELQGHLEARIKTLELTLKSAKVVDQEVAEVAEVSEVNSGSTVSLWDLTHNEEVTYTLVNPREAEPASSKISTASPLGKALMGKKKGEIVEVVVPAGIHHYQIKNVEPSS